MEKRLGSLARFEEVDGVRQVNHLVIDLSWNTVDDTLPMLVQYDNEYRPRIRFSPYAEANEMVPPPGYVTLTGEEFLSVLVWLIRRGLLEDVGLVSTETEDADDCGPHQCRYMVMPEESQAYADQEAERIQAIVEWGIEQERARIAPRVHGGDGVEDDGKIIMHRHESFYQRERTETSTESGDTPRLMTMVVDETSVDDVGARHASPVQEVLDDDDLVEGSGDPSWLEMPTVMRHLHHDQELSVTDIARVCGTTYARVKGALKRLGIERRSYRGGRSKIVSAPAPESAAQ